MDDQFAALNVAHGDTVESLKKELADLTADLHRRNIAMASLSEKAARMELQMREQDENIQRKDAAIQVTRLCLFMICLLWKSLTISCLRPRLQNGDLIDVSGTHLPKDNLIVIIFSPQHESQINEEPHNHPSMWYVYQSQWVPYFVFPLKVANAQLEALRLESRHLRRTVLRTTSGDTDDAQEQLRELQNAYNSSLAALEVRDEWHTATHID